MRDLVFADIGCGTGASTLVTLVGHDLSQAIAMMATPALDIESLLRWCED